MSFRFSCPYTSPQNGKAERKIRSINNIIRTVLTHSSLPPSYWHHALAMATYILNILPSKTKSHLTPTRLLYHKSPTYSHLRVFGCLCYPLLPTTSINKLQNRSSPCVFLGYPPNHRGYLCLDLSTKKILISRHVLFDEMIFPFRSSAPTQSYEFLHKNINDDPHPSIHHYYHLNPSPPTSETQQPPSTTQTPAQFGQTYSRHRTKHTNAEPNHLTSTSTTEPHSVHPPPETAPEPTVPGAAPASPNPPPPPARTMQTRSMTGHSKPRVPFSFQTSTAITPLPKNLKDALASPTWNHAMQEEFSALIDNKTWEHVPRCPNMNVIRSMWIFKHKLKSDGSLERYKARLVGDGRTQQVGVDCSDTFSPVVKPATIRTVLSIALHHRWDISQLDVKNAFLHGTLHETVYMHQPPGFRNAHFPHHVCRLKKSLYGLKQAPRAWYQRFTDYVGTLGFRLSSSDNSLFIFHQGQNVAYILLYVDDIILVTSSPELKASFMTHLSTEFAMKDLGPLSYFLGISVQWSPDGLFLSQGRYAQEILERAKMDDCNPVSTPVDTTGKLSASSGDLLDDPTTYRNLAGALQYLTFTRPDISYAVQQVCMFMHAPRTGHFNALKRILRYVKGTLGVGIMMRPSSLSTLIAYTDADWAELCWIRNLLLELRYPIRRASLVYTDNVSAMYLSGNPVQHQRTKHVEVDIHFVRELVRRGYVRVLHIPSRHNFSDIFTKGLPRVLFEDFRSSLSLRDPPP
ncbi:hypothetical protein OSB04_016119 [Centaurea solstitialis]|uniref:Integrase catalytic domain-containing protein n=1 Tax=Centaurea solstitialis TaxID=347529 RepID=A0AA38T0B5_9ASTR|nr:hypothetical protein OSB04_016119 [Centaurea solstitialis]